MHRSENRMTGLTGRTAANGSTRELLQWAVLAGPKAVLAKDAASTPMSVESPQSPMLHDARASAFQILAPPQKKRRTRFE